LRDLPLVESEMKSPFLRLIIWLSGRQFELLRWTKESSSCSMRRNDPNVGCVRFVDFLSRWVRVIADRDVQSAHGDNVGEDKPSTKRE